MPPLVAFLIALSLLGLFIWYFGTDSDRRQRIIGTVLALGLVGFCLYSVIPPSEKIKLGMDLAGGARFTLKLDAGNGMTLTKEDQEQAREVLYKRLSEGKADTNINIALEGDENLIVDVPHDEELQVDTATLDDIRTKLTKAANLNFHMSHVEDSAGKVAQVESGDAIVLDALILPFLEGMEKTRTKMIVEKDPIISGDDVKNAWASKGISGWEISVSLMNEGPDELFKQSKKYAGTPRQMAIVLDGEVISAPVFRQAIAGGTAQITGDFTVDQARTLATSMKNPLRTVPTIEHEDFFPPTLAESAVDQGLRAGLWGLGLTALFMLIFYRFAGIIALIGLSVNVVLLFGILAIFQADFTLTGIAGVILTIGIAIDANVLIYERLREERDSGKSIGAAIQAAYEKAFSAIFDAQVTTLITAMILLSLAEGAIKGFAVTLTIGIIVSLFSALLVTRVCFNWLIAGDTLRSLNFMNTLAKRAIDFIGTSKKTRILSAALIVLAVAVLGIKGSGALGVEFAGGEQVRFQAADSATTESVAEVVNTLDLSAEAKVQSLTPVGGEGQTFSVRVEEGKGSETAAKITEAGLVAEGTEVGTSKISSVVAGEMAKNSLIALVVGLAAIFLYVTLRFEYSFAIGAIAALIHDLVICIGITVLSGRELNLILVGAFLTIAGYSINDTIVVFDRIREGLRNKRGDVKDIMNQAINATLSRTILTSLTTLLTVGCLFLFGGKALNDFSFAVIIGVLVGTYSSIFVASPIVHWWAKRSKTNLRREVLDADQEKVTADPTASA